MEFSKLLSISRRCFNSIAKRSKSSTCKPIPIVVTVTGANSRMGSTVALLLKQCSFIDKINLFDYNKGSVASALDLSHIDTNSNVEGFEGLNGLRPAVKDAKIVVVCGGGQLKPGYPDNELFVGNADYVRNIAVHTAEFNPKAILCICTPPIPSMIPLASEEYKKANTYNARKIVGVVSLGVMVANSIVGAHVKVDPTTIMCPIVGGMGCNTIVPVISQTKLEPPLSSPMAKVLRNKVSRAADDVLAIKLDENAGPLSATSALGAARFVTSVAKGLMGKFTGFECGFVRQSGEYADFLPYMASVITLGKYGVEHVYLPNLDSFECMDLQRAAPIIKKQIELGEGYVTGLVPRKIRRCRHVAPKCEIIRLKKLTKIDDFAFEPQ